MGWGVVEDSRTPFPLGTVLLAEDKTDDSITIGPDGLKRKGNVILQPQPDDNPNDPLMWSTTWKVAHLFILAFGSAATNALTTIVVPGLQPLTEKFGVSDADVSTLIVTAPTFFTGVSAFVVVAGAEIWGRRPFYMLSIVVLAIANFAAFLAQTYPVLVAARTIAGIFSAPLFTLVTASIADIFFVHQRGMAVAFWNFSLTIGGQVGQIIAGFIVDALGVSAVFGLAAAVFAGLCAPAFFIVLESGYFTRGEAPPLRSTTDEFDDIDDAKAAAHTPSRISYLKQLALFRGRMTQKSFWLGILKPFCFISSPIVFYTMLTNSLFLVLLAGVSTLMAIIFAAPPYNLTPTQIGLTNLPLFGAALVSGPLVGWLSDASVRLMARTNGKNRGVAEPEFRLVILFLAFPIVSVGLVGLGTAIQKGQSLFTVLAWLSMISFGNTAGVQVSINYLIDCLPAHSAQAFSTVNMIAALVVFAGISPLIGWLENSGPVVVFGSLASASVVLMVLGVPYYIFGKRIRAWYGRAEWAQYILR